MRLARGLRGDLRRMADGRLDPSSPQGQEIIKRVLRRDFSAAIKACEKLPKGPVAKAMKACGYNATEVGHTLFASDPAGRAAYYAEQGSQQAKTGQPGFDQSGNPTGTANTDPFAKGAPADLSSSTNQEVPEYLDPAARMRRPRPY